MIRKSLLFFVFLFQVCLLNGFSQSQIPQSRNWRSFSPDSGVFTVSFPGAPKYIKENVPVGSANVTHHRYLLLNNTVGYGVEFMEFPVPINEEALQTLFSALWERMAKQLGAKDRATTKIQTKGCGGLEKESVFGRTALLKARVFLSGQKFFMIWHVSESGEKETGRFFFDSFEISDGCSGVAALEAPSDEVKTSYLDGVVDSSTGWRKVTSDRDGFSVLVPAPFFVEEKQEQLPPVPLFSRTYSSKKGDAIYTVLALGDFSPDTIDTNVLRKALLDTHETLLRKKFVSLGAEMRLTRNLTLGQYPGREYAITSETKVGRAQLFITKQKIYMAVAFDLKGEQAQKNFDIFFNFLRITVK